MLEARYENILGKCLDEMTQKAVLGELLGDLVHELSNPLQVALGFAQGLEDFTLQPSYSNDLKLIVEEVQKCCQLLKKVRALQQEIKTKNTCEDMPKLLEEVIPLVSYRIRKKHLTLDVHLVPTIGLVKSEDVAIRTAILAGLLAAIEKTKERSSIGVYVYPKPPETVVEIKFLPQSTPETEQQDSAIDAYLGVIIKSFHTCTVDGVQSYLMYFQEF